MNFGKAFSRIQHRREHHFNSPITEWQEINTDTRTSLSAIERERFLKNEDSALISQPRKSETAEELRPLEKCDLGLGKDAEQRMVGIPPGLSIDWLHWTRIQEIRLVTNTLREYSR